jgi:toxin ParE1/3/4
VKGRAVILSPEAREDLIALYDWIAAAAHPQTALGYIERIETYCQGMRIGSERGTRRDDIRPGLRIVTFERRVTIAFTVDPARVVILRLFYAGRNWEDLPP